jgi:hypothetical protein
LIRVRCSVLASGAMRGIIWCLMKPEEDDASS